MPEQDKELEFDISEDLLEEVAEFELEMELEGVESAELVESAEALVPPTPLMGTWLNVDSHTRGIVKIIIGFRGGRLAIRVYGACHPTPCDWGVVSGYAYSSGVTSRRAIAFSAVYRKSFKDTIVTGYLSRGGLVVETFNHFKDSSGRYDYYSRGYFRRA